MFITKTLAHQEPNCCRHHLLEPKLCHTIAAIIFAAMDVGCHLLELPKILQSELLHGSMNGCW